MAQLFKKLIAAAAIALFFTACTKESGLLVSDNLEIEQRAVVQEDNVLVTPTAVPQSLARPKKSLAIWADCEGFATIGTPSSFKPTAGNFDELYNGANFKDGLGAVSESKPGDQDFNGGRWHVNTLKAGVDPDKYINVCSVEEIDPNDFESTSTYFECPLLPARGKAF